MFKGASAEWLEDDLTRAGKVQRSFLPDLPTTIQGLRIAVRYRPAYDVGGDFYDVVRLPDGRVTALIGDVAGKGVTAALMMARVSTEFRRLALERLGPRRLLERLNDWILAHAPSDDIFVTAASIQMQPARGRWIAANAGHVCPLLRRQDGTIFPFAEASGTPLGIGLSRDPYEEVSVDAHRGDVLVLATDGIVEVLHQSDAPYTEAGLLELLRMAPAEVNGMVDHVLAAVERCPGRRDDATLLAMALEAPSPELWLAEGRGPARVTGG